MDRSLIICGNYWRATGYGCHVREIVRALARLGTRLQLVKVSGGSLSALPAEKRDSWFDTLNGPVNSAATLHICVPDQLRVAQGMLNVIWTTFEATRIPERWAKISMSQDLVVLPTESSKRAWMEGGVPEERIELCPLAVDSGRFRPGIKPLDLGRRSGRRILDYKTRVLNISDFTSVPRKNILGMLRVWLRTTSSKDDAILILKLSGYRHRWWRPDRFKQRISEIEKEIGKPRRKAAPVIFVDRNLAESDMPSLYAAATHYWSMSHGEGWDFPMMEAGAMGLHLIAPNHTAYTAYLDDSVAQMIPSRRIAANFRQGKGLGKLFEGSDWWQPDENVAAEIIAKAVQKGRDGLPTARIRIADGFTWERSAKRLIEILEKLYQRHGKKF